jgi:hypothetical protein
MKNGRNETKFINKRRVVAQIPIRDTGFIRPL